MKKGFKFEILKEVEEKVVKMDIELDNNLRDLLVLYATEKASKKELEEILISWSFTDILKKQIKAK